MIQARQRFDKYVDERLDFHFCAKMISFDLCPVLGDLALCIVCFDLVGSMRVLICCFSLPGVQLLSQAFGISSICSGFCNYR